MVRRGNSLAVVIAAAAAALVLAVAGAAAAQPAAPTTQSARVVEAVAQYNRGRELMRSQRYQEAAAAFEASHKLDPGWGTLYNLAQCYERIGKLASAQALYRELARPDSYPRGTGVTAERDRAGRKDAGQRADALDRRIPRLRITAASVPPGLVIRLDGAELSQPLGSDRPVDLGSHQLTATAPGHKDFETTATLTEEAKTVAVEIELVASEPRPPSEPRTPPADPPAPATLPAGEAAVPPLAAKPDEPAPSSSRRTLGLVSAAGGGVLVATGLVFGQLASSKWDDAQGQCPNRICQNAGALNAGIVGDARTFATVSTVLVIGGAAAVAAGAVLYLTAPTPAAHAVKLTPQASPGGIAVVLDGRF